MSENTTARLIRRTLTGNIPMFIFILSVFAGFLALQLTPREEEPQIVVPMVDILVNAPGINATQVERQVTTPLEKLLAQIPGVEHVYSSTNNGHALVTLRFYVGENRERSILNTYNKLHSNLDRIPPVVSSWVVKPVEVDDVPIVMLGLWSDDPAKTSDYQLLRLAQEVSTRLQGIEHTSEVKVVAGRPRMIQVNIKPEQLSARKTTALEIIQAIQLSNVLSSNGNWSFNDKAVQLESGDILHDIDELKALPVNVIDGAPVLLRDVAEVVDGQQQANSYSWIDFAEHQGNQPAQLQNLPLVTISVAKQRGSNAVAVAQAVHEEIANLSAKIFPPEVHVTVLRDYGDTANEKVNDLTSSLAFAIFTVVVFIGVFLGWRPALVIGLAVPICYGFTLALDLAFGYTINRVTLFALILALGLLVDDPITGVDNIERFFRKAGGNRQDKIVSAINEIRVPLVLSTLTIMLAFVPLAFITGMMGPYMAPMAFNVPMSLFASTVVAFMVTPWLSGKLIKTPAPESADALERSTFYRFYRRLLEPLLASRRKTKLVLFAVLVLFIGTALLPVFRLVPLKLLPFDNKNEVQIILDMPEGTTLEHTAALAQQVSQKVQQLPEVKAVASFVGVASPMDFNGLVRHYYLRNAVNNGDMRITLLDKSEREHQSHGIVLRLRQLLAPLNVDGVNIKVVEVPPGPPVLSTLVAELYGDEITSYQQLRDAAKTVAERMAREPMVVEVDSTVEADQPRLRFVADKNKAALSGVSTQDISDTINIANQGQIAGYLHLPREALPLPINVRMPERERQSVHDFERLTVKGRIGVVQQSTAQGIENAPQPLVAIGELGQFQWQQQDKSIQHKDLKPVVYVTADISGRPPGEVIADISSDLGSDSHQVNDWHQRTFLSNGGGDGWQLPDNIQLSFSGEGEWRITIRVFRDMGIAFAFALVAIYFVLRIQTASMALSLIIMSAIPLTIIGIMPGFFLLNQFGEREIANAPEPVLFTATAMIGMIALAGIVVRNSLILVEFITQARAEGLALKPALIQAGAVRMRPVLLTAGTTLLGNLVITLDPVFSGLAIAIIFGIIASTLFTLLIVPLVYLLVFDKSAEEKA